MKKLLLIAACAALFYSPQAKAESLTFYTFDFAPFSGELAAGPFKDILGEACAKLGHTCEFAVMPWKRAQEMAKNEGGVSGLFPMGKNEEREEWMTFSVPLIETEYGFFVPVDETIAFSGLKSLDGYTVSTFGPSNTSQNLEDIAGEAGLTPAIEKSMDIAMKKVAGKRYGDKNAVYGNTDVMKHLIKTGGISGLKYLGQHKPVVYYVGMPQNTVSAETAAAMNETLSVMKADGTIAGILAKYDMKVAE